jgi:hypothetical protein
MANLTIKLTEIAYLDLEEIESYMSQSSPKIGREFVNKISTPLVCSYFSYSIFLIRQRI